MSDTFIFYRNYFECAKRLSPKHRLSFFENLCNYALNGIEPVDDNSQENIAFVAIKPHIDSSMKRLRRTERARTERLSRQNAARQSADKDKDNVNVEVEDKVKDKEKVECSSSGSATTTTTTTNDFNSDFPPSEDTVVKVVESKQKELCIPEWYARWWYSKMQGVGWVNGKGYKLKTSNWLNNLRVWWEKSTEAEREKIRSDLRGPALSEDERGSRKVYIPDIRDCM